MSFRTLLVLLVVVMAFAVTGITVISYSLQTFYTGPFVDVSTVDTIYSNLQEGAKNMLHACVTQEAEEVENRLSLAKEEFNEMLTQSEALGKNYSGSQEDITAITEGIQFVNEKYDQFAELCRANDIDGAFKIYNEEMLSTFGTITERVTAIQEYSYSNAERSYNNAIGVRTLCFVLLLVVGISSIMLGLYLATIISKMLVAGIREVKDAADKMAEGDFDITFTYENQDELGELAQRMREMTDTTRAIIDDVGFLLGKMADGDFTVGTKIEEQYVGIYEQLKLAMRGLNRRLNETLLNIQTSAEQVNLGASQMSESAQALAEGATDQAGAVEELQATITNVNGMVTANAEQMNDSYKHTQEYRTQAMESGSEMENLMAAMERISETSRQINNIVSEIEDIASQTNLLSLNASIEAARAGEAGRGFAVVADQIRELADSSAQSAVHTRELIETSLREIENGNQITGQTANALHQVVDGMETLANNTREAMENSNTQAEAMEQINQGIEQISSVIQNNSAAAEETSATSEELTAQSVNMNEMVTAFKLRRE